MSSNRRELLRWLLLSPLCATPAVAAAQRYLVDGVSAADVADALTDALATTPEEALNVFDLERIAAVNLPPAHYGYVASGAGDNSTMQANREAIERVRLRLRRLVGVGRVDTAVTLFGRQYSSPVFLCPLGSLGAMHVSGELAVARAARANNTAMAMSTFSSKAIEDVNESRGQPVWFQLYMLANWRATTAMIRRAEAAGCDTMLVTVDTPMRALREDGERYTALDDRDCTNCHSGGRPSPRLKPMAANLDFSGPTELSPSTLNWAAIDRLRDITSLRIVIKGLETGEDAELAREHGVDGIVLSNHGGRGIHASRGTLDCLPEVLGGAGDLPVLIDGGFRRGTDVFKALALGATAVGVGRPYAWGLGAFGEAGVARVIDLLNRELVVAMTQAGAKSIADIRQGMVVA